MIVCGNNNCQITTEILHTILGRGTRAEPAARAGDNDVARDRKELQDGDGGTGQPLNS